MIYTRESSKVAGSEARGEGKERGNLPATTAKPPVDQRACGTCFLFFFMFDVRLPICASSFPKRYDVYSI